MSQKHPVLFYCFIVLLFWGRYQKGKSWCRDEFDGAVVILSLRESALFGKTLTV